MHGRSHSKKLFSASVKAGEMQWHTINGADVQPPSNKKGKILPGVKRCTSEAILQRARNLIQYKKQAATLTRSLRLLINQPRRAADTAKKVFIEFVCSIEKKLLKSSKRYLNNL